MPKYCKAVDIPFDLVSTFLQACFDAKPVRKGLHLKRFREACIPRDSDDLYQIYRLLLPQLDRDRGNYNLKEAKLASALVKACGLDPKTSADANRAVNWKKLGTKGAGNFATVMEQYLFSKSCGRQEGTPQARMLTVGEVNEKLNQLAYEDTSEGKIAALRWLVLHTTTRQMRWIVGIILKDIKVGISETRILRDFHGDAEHLYNLTMDLGRVCRELRDPNKRYPRKDVEPGSSIRPQLASRASSPEEAFHKIRSRPFLVEVKFDGERIQVHKIGETIQYFSRRGREHGEGSDYNVMDIVVKGQVAPSCCILDGEMVVWNKTKKMFEPFGGLRSSVRAAKEGVRGGQVVPMSHGDGLYNADPDYEYPLAEDIELVYVAFDVVYVEDQSVMNRTLQERLDMLATVVTESPLEGTPVGGGVIRARLVPLLPGKVLLHDVAFSKVGETVGDIQEMYDRALSRQEEGIIVKSLDSSWVSNDRSNSWLKVKPDYIEKVDIDAVIIGGYYGTGKHGGKLAEYLLGLAEAPRSAAAEPSMFISFCRVGTGVSDKERQELRDRLSRYLVPADRRAPRCYRVSGQPRERPDVWVADPMKSVVVEVVADVRTIASRQFASPYSLRFPRISRLRWDKGATDVMTDEQLDQIVRENKGAITAGAKKGDLQDMWVAGRFKSRRKKNGGKNEGDTPGRPVRSVVVSHFMPTDTSDIEVEVDVLQQEYVAFLNYGPHKKEELQRLVKRLGGRTSETATPSVKYVVAAEDDWRVQRMRHQKVDRMDVYTVGWLRECEAHKRRIEAMPRHYWHLSTQTRLDHHSSIDLHGDPFFLDVTAEDVKSLLELHVNQLEVEKTRRRALEAEKKLREAEDDDMPMELEGVLPLDQTVLVVEQDLQRLGMGDAEVSLFRGCCLCLITLKVKAKTSSTPRLSRRKATLCPPVPLLKGVSSATSLASAWEAAEVDMYLQRVTMEVRRHGGKIVKHLGPEVTHVVLVPLEEEEEVVETSPEAATMGLLSRRKVRSSCKRDLLGPTDPLLTAPTAPVSLEASTVLQHLRDATEKAVGASLETAPPTAPMGPPSSHKKVLAPTPVQSIVAPEMLVARRLSQLKARLSRGKVQLVDIDWINDSLAALKQYRSMARRKSELQYVPHIVVHDEGEGRQPEGEEAVVMDYNRWPWEDFGAGLDVGTTTSASASGGSSAGEEVKQKRKKKRKEEGTAETPRLNSGKRKRKVVPSGADDHERMEEHKPKRRSRTKQVDLEGNCSQKARRSRAQRAGGDVGRTKRKKKIGKSIDDEQEEEEEVEEMAGTHSSDGGASSGWVEGHTSDDKDETGSEHEDDHQEFQEETETEGGGMGPGRGRQRLSKRRSGAGEPSTPAPSKTYRTSRKKASGLPASAHVLVAPGASRRATRIQQMLTPAGPLTELEDDTELVGGKEKVQEGKGVGRKMPRFPQGEEEEPSRSRSQGGRRMTRLRHGAKGAFKEEPVPAGDLTSHGGGPQEIDVMSGDTHLETQLPAPQAPDSGITSQHSLAPLFSSMVMNLFSDEEQEEREKLPQEEREKRLQEASHGISHLRVSHPSPQTSPPTRTMLKCPTTAGPVSAKAGGPVVDSLTGTGVPTEYPIRPRGGLAADPGELQESGPFTGPDMGKVGASMAVRLQEEEVPDQSGPSTSPKGPISPTTKAPHFLSQPQGPSGNPGPQRKSLRDRVNAVLKNST